MLFVISGISGSGKSTVVEGVTQRMSGVRRVINVTSRPKRQGEVDGIHYFFVSRNSFKKLIQRRLFVEYAEVYGHYYGVMYTSLKGLFSEDNTGIVTTDVQGARIFMKKVAHVVSIFIDIPAEIATQHIYERGGNPEEIRRRTEMMYSELSLASSFNFRVTNVLGQPEKAVEEVCEIIRAQSKVE